ncbi:hypothetical protein ACEN9X_19380 [Mucilaginibacter sp. Mucisp86]
MEIYSVASQAAMAIVEHPPTLDPARLITAMHQTVQLIVESAKTETAT